MSKKIRCPYCGALYDPDHVDHEPLVDYDAHVEMPVECVIVPVGSPQTQRLRGGDY